ncbi:MAG: hypothetical protein IT165_07650 [Bryobacterales bacterium]|nr:hypothetical protein [Bryobacterales bacterium]
MSFRILFLGMLSLCAWAQTAYMPLREVKAGMRGKGYTVFTGERVDPFDVEILGILENAGPKQSVILAKLSGGPLQHTGVMQGMSGSPVYINGRLVGAVALAFAFSKDPIAGIRPFEEMLEAKAVNRAESTPRCTPLACEPAQVLAANITPAPFAWGDAKLVDIATPLSFSGFTSAAIEAFSPQLRALGLEPRQGVTGGSRARLPAGDPAALKPGSMISVQLMSGDMTVGADGTLTAIDGKRIYAFGHRFVSMGDVEMPFASADVIALLPNVSTSFKISTARKWMGAITADYSTAVRGEIGRKAHMVPVNITVKGGARLSKYHVEMVRDAALTPYLLQMAAFSAIDATERTLGTSSYSVRQRVEFANAAPMNSLNIYSGEFNIPMLAAQSGAIPVAYAMQTGFRDLNIKSVDLEIESFEKRRQVTIEEVSSGRRTVRPGDTVNLEIVFASEGRRFTRKAAYQVPPGAPAGVLNFTVSDALMTNFAEFGKVVMVPPRTPDQVVHLLNNLRGNTKAYVRVWRAEPAFQAQGEDIPDPPPSAANLYARSQGAAATPNYNSKIAELDVPLDNVMVSGSKTISVEVTE